MISSKFDNHHSIAINKGTSPFVKDKILDNSKHIHFRDSQDIISKFTNDNVTVSKKRKREDIIERSFIKYSHPFIHKLYSTYKAHLLN